MPDKDPVQPKVSADTPVEKIVRLTSRQRSALAGLGVQTAWDAVNYYPFRFDDFSAVSRIADAAPGEQVTIIAKVARVNSRRSFRQRRLSMTEALLEDESGQIKAIWFHQPYIASKLKAGESYRFAGKVTLNKYGPSLISPLYEEAERRDGVYALPLVPVYPLAAGVSQFVIRRLVGACRELAGQLPDHLPAALLRRHQLIGLSQALVGIHFPKTAAEAAAARRRLAFDEMLRLQLYVGKQRRFRQGSRAVEVPFDLETTRSLVGRLPFRLTNDQRRAAWEILKDMNKPTPMHRLLDGDVGSGKTVVAAIAMINAARAGYQAALMAPTEILAKQHFETLRKVMDGQGVRIALWTNSYKIGLLRGRPAPAVGKAAVSKLAGKIATGGYDVVIGTHALIEESVVFHALALVVIDEQHRFGVRARQALCAKSGRPGFEPHLLSMTATPIPRSLAMTFYGDLDISLLKEKPQDRKPIITRVVRPSGRAAAFAAVRRELDAGRQAFIVCPLIDPSDAHGSVSVAEAYERLIRTDLPGVPAAMLHGKLPAEEKERIMAEFLAGRTKVLVSTSVIEVGIDVPNATMMCIEGAERFGLSQLHQFRGRVGRGEHQSHCLLLPGDASPEALERLAALAATSDGFILADKDLKMRGPGDLLGTAQSGFPTFHLASFSDLEMIRDARTAADELLLAESRGELPPAAHELLSRIEGGHVHLE
ncbi:MAG: ATP-dependent DNA helicase RecG [Patescibacteria group bacterium]|jgi:ATP-dependent DNA helicase RecG